MGAEGGVDQRGDGMRELESLRFQESENRVKDRSEWRVTSWVRGR